MNHSRLAIATLAAVACLATWLCRDATPAQEKVSRAPGTQWEYKIMFGRDLAELAAAPNPYDPNTDNTNEVEEKGLNKLGAENWELVDVMYVGPNAYHYSFKRPKTPK